MTSIGNDIVSLESPRSKRFAQKEYYSKIISSEEEDDFHQRLAGRLSFGNYVWLLWSIKEAAFKYFKRSDSGFLFNPLKITTENIGLKDRYSPLTINKFPIENRGFESSELLNGQVYIQGDRICTRSMIAEDFIFSVVSDETALDKIYWGIQRIDTGDYKTQSAEVRKFTMHKLKDIFPDQNFFIEKNDTGVPGIVCGNKLYPVSFSHHEKYIAYAFMLQTAE